jgi:SAM-dependent methyltransferase
MTRLSRIHPYPGMIADDLAVELAEAHVRRGDRVLDPFCGTGRTLLAAAQLGATAVGVDTNPLAGLLVKAKAGRCSAKALERFATELGRRVLPGWRGIECDLEEGRKVSWFSAKARRELSGLICFINRRNLRPQELCLVAGILSATAREVSYCRNDQWKIHRLAPAKRSAFKKSAYLVFLNRLNHVVAELRSSGAVPGSCKAILGDSRRLREVLNANSEGRRFDLVLSSPPYGDSRTTVQYGGVSTLCLGVLKHLKGLKVRYDQAGSIDRCCLGGSLQSVGRPSRHLEQMAGRFWSGRDTRGSKRRVIVFLNDLEQCCREIVSVMKVDGTAIFVVARRTVGGSRVKLDRYLVDVMGRLGCTCERVTKRRISGKLTPYVIHSRGNSSRRSQGRRWRVATMREEYVLFFKKGPPNGPAGLRN